MKKITMKAVKAFNEGKDFSLDNTSVFTLHDTDGVPVCVMRLYRSIIAWRVHGRTFFCLHGYNTVTTRERLNCLLSCKLRTAKGVLYAGVSPIDGCIIYEDSASCAVEVSDAMKRYLQTL